MHASIFRPSKGWNKKVEKQKFYTHKLVILVMIAATKKMCATNYHNLTI